MLPIKPKELSSGPDSVLADLQAIIDSEPDFIQRVDKAKQLWKSKDKKHAQKVGFDEIREQLKSMCVAIEVCNYCEANEATDIEHIYPKSFFPEVCFKWDNYILACKTCNSGYKLDKCFVLEPNGELLEVKRGTEPKYKTVAFINQRVENPNDFMILNTEVWQFEPLPNLCPADLHKTEKTIEILELNIRDALIEGRKSEAKNYYNYLQRLANIVSSKNFDELENYLSPYEDKIDKNSDLDSVKQSLKESYRIHITTRMRHPAVWFAIKLISSRTNQKWKKLFEQVPEALNW